MAADMAGQLPVISLVNPSTGARFDFCGRWLRSSPATERDVRLGRAQFRGDKVWLNLPPGVQAQLDKGVLQMVHGGEPSEPDPWQGDEGPWTPNGMSMPPGNAAHTAWRDYAIGQGMPAAEAAGLSRDQIRMRFTAPGADRDDAPDLEVLDQDPDARAARQR